MKQRTPPNIIAAERLTDGLVITFSDNRCALYTSELLYGLLDVAQVIDELPWEESDKDGDSQHAP